MHQTINYTPLIFFIKRKGLLKNDILPEKQTFFIFHISTFFFFTVHLGLIRRLLLAVFSREGSLILWTSAPIEVWKWNFPPFPEIMTDGQTDIFTYKKYFWNAMQGGGESKRP